ncbi:MAG TPA: hypothetical protein VNU27_14075 [Candidatus Acidoferrum sp.]|nr:hypothetical protein [Candidatus Acidoferrum sp.]
MPLTATPPSASNQLITIGIIVAILGIAMYRRMRPQPVRPTRLLITAGVIVVITVISWATAPGIFKDPLALAVAPLAIAVGLGLGTLLVRVSRIWRSENGELWMSGGLPFAAIFLGTLVLRFTLTYAATGEFFPSGNSRAYDHPSSATDLAADLLLLSVGLWLARAALFLRRYRQNEAASAPL